MTAHNTARIMLLDSCTADQIAAGEVVERPASVVKELVENSLDADARHISIEVEASGLASIQVRDDGRGINGEDVSLAFSRHATSKIHLSRDLAAIKTLGFRGEALPSIAAVSRVEMVTRPGGVLAGKKVTIAGGELLETTETGCPPGTVVTVTDLFYNTPARRRYLKKPSTEARAIAITVERLALSHPEVAFELSLEGRRSLSTPGDGNLHTVIAAIYGLEVGLELLPVKESGEEWHVEGFISPPWLHRASRGQQALIVNGRYIQNYVLARGVEECYQAVIPRGRHPIFVIHLHIDPQQIDVNVHPAKLEVRFQREYDLAREITIPVKRALITPGAIAPATMASPPKQRRELLQTQQSFYFREQVKKAQAWGEYMVKESLPWENSGHNNSGTPHSLETEETQAHLNKVTAKKGEQVLFPLRAVGQIFNTYILAEGKDGLYIIDQHAAHELCRFANLQKKVNAGSWPGQMLEPPLTLQFTPATAVKIMEQVVTLKNLGFIVEKFGVNVFLLRSVPVGVPPGKEREVLEDFLEDSFLPAPERLLKVIACHGSIKAGEMMSKLEMQKLLEELQDVNRPYTCPHGRPAVVRLDRFQLARYFQRTAP